MIVHKIIDEPTNFRAAGCFCLCGDSLLLIQRQQLKSFAMHWAIPTGKIEQGETPRACMARELGEELGLKVEQTDLRPLSNFMVEDQGTRFEYVSFALVLPYRPTLNLKIDEVHQANWVSIDQVLKRRVVPYFYNTLHDFLDWHKNNEIQWRFLPNEEANSAKRRRTGRKGKRRVPDEVAKSTTESGLSTRFGADLFRQDNDGQCVYPEVS